MTKGFRESELCVACQGKCCKQMPGAYYPFDFEEPLLENVEKMLQAKLISIDWWEGDPRKDIPEEERLSRVYFIRPRTKDTEKIFDPSWGGECVMLTETGCSLPFEKRPFECRMLEPQEDGCDKHGITKGTASIEWLEHQEAIERIGNKLNYKIK